MFIKVDKRVFELPPPVAAAGETLVWVTSYALIEVPPRARAHRFAFENQVAKLLFFLWREGIALTANKVRASFLQRRIARQRQIVFAIGRLAEGDAAVVALGPQDCPEAEVQRFPSDLVLALEADQDPAGLYARVHAHLTQQDERLAGLFHHSPYSGRPLGFAFGDLVPERGEAGKSVDAKRRAFRDIAFPATQPSVHTGPAARHEVFLVGAGAYACAYILPSLPGLTRNTVVDLNPALAATVAERFGFRHRDTDAARAFERLAGAEEPVVILAGYHSTHVEHAAMALAANRGARVLVEKPPALDMAGAGRLAALRRAGGHVEIGYNRRFAPLTQAAQREIAGAEGPLSVTCVVKELRIPDSHWYYWPSQGTRILGNVGHWVDFGVSLIDADPVSLVIASAEGSIPGDEIAMTVLFGDGSRLTVVATELGNGLRGVQEFIDVRRGDLTLRIDDYLSMTVERGGRRRVRRRRIRDKGHAAMYRAFANDIAAGRGPAYPDRALLATTRILTAAAEAAKQHRHGSVIPLETRAIHD
jgi:predicted dehydrogenase